MHSPTYTGTLDARDEDALEVATGLTDNVSLEVARVHWYDQYYDSTSRATNECGRQP